MARQLVNTDPPNMVNTDPNMVNTDPKMMNTDPNMVNTDTVDTAIHLFLVLVGMISEDYGG